MLDHHPLSGFFITQPTMTERAGDRSRVLKIFHWLLIYFCHKFSYYITTNHSKPSMESFYSNQNIRSF